MPFYLIYLLCLVFQFQAFAGSPNQTDTLSPIYPGSSLPFQISVELADFALPSGYHSGVQGTCEGKWILLAGRTNGLHGFGPTDNFPPDAQNTVIYVVDPLTGIIHSKNLTESSSGLTQSEIDLLSVTSPQGYQKHNTLYMTGGYGVDTATGEFSTKPFLTAIDLPGLMEWVMNPTPTLPARASIRFLENPIFQVTGGYMARGEGNQTLLIFGQNFLGQYTSGSNGTYIEQVRRFYIRDNGKTLSVREKKSLPELPDPNYRRRDLNIVPIVRNLLGESVPSFVALSGVFTEAGGIWTVPVMINIDGKTEMDDPMKESTFKQAMNNYTSPVLGMYSGHFGSMYMTIFGGLSLGYFDANGFQTDEEIPFINQITTIQYDSHARFTQYLMDATYPVILSTASNPGNVLLFGAGAAFMPVQALSAYDNSVIKYDHLNNGRSLIGYIVGGIQSTLPNTSSRLDSAASPYIFKVYVQKNH